MKNNFLLILLFIPIAIFSQKQFLFSLDDTDYVIYQESIGSRIENLGSKLSFVNTKTGKVNTLDITGKTIKTIEQVKIDSLKINYVLIHIMDAKPVNPSSTMEHQLHFYSLDGLKKQQIVVPKKIIIDYAINDRTGTIVLVLKGGTIAQPEKENEIKVYDLKTFTEIRP